MSTYQCWPKCFSNTWSASLSHQPISWPMTEWSLRSDCGNRFAHSKVSFADCQQPCILRDIARLNSKTRSWSSTCGFWQVWAGYLSQVITFDSVCLWWFHSSLNTDDVIQGQLPLPPANAVEGTKSPVKHQVRNTNRCNSDGIGRDSPASPVDLVGSQGMGIKICCEDWYNYQNVTIEFGNNVWLSTWHFCMTRPLKKPNYKHTGLYIVNEISVKNAENLQLPKTMCNEQILNISQLECFTPQGFWLSYL